MDQEHGGNIAGGKIVIERLPYKKKNLISFDIGSETDK